jgi:methionine synthase I (cobalamin-dependent)
MVILTIVIANLEEPQAEAAIESMDSTLEDFEGEFRDQKRVLNEANADAILVKNAQDELNVSDTVVIALQDFPPPSTEPPTI